MTELAYAAGVSNRTIYNWKNWQSDHETLYYNIKILVLEIRKHLPRIGTIKLYHILKLDMQLLDINIGRDKFHQILKDLKLLVPKRKKFTRTTDSNHRFRKYENLVKLMKINKPEQLWVADITYIKSASKTFYLTIITDAYSKKIMGFYLADNMKTESSKKALIMALNDRKHPNRKLTHHSDRGFQFCAPEYTDVLKANKIKISMTTKYDPYENSIAERVNGILKDEFEISSIKSHENEVNRIVSSSISKYNNMRPHFSCQLMTPEQAHVKGKFKMKKWGKFSFNEIWN